MMTDQALKRAMCNLVERPLAVSLAPDVVLVDHAQDAVYEGKTAVAAVLTSFLEDGFSEKAAVRTLLVQQPVALLEVMVRGRHRRPFMGIPPTDREVTLPLALVCRWQTGRLHHVALYYDAGSLLRQLDLAL